MGTTKALIKETIDSKLGITGRAVELKDPDYKTAVGMALKMLARWHPMTHYITLPVSASVQKYAVNVPNLLGVKDLTFFNNGGRYTAYPYPDASVDHQLIMGELKVQQKVYEDLPQWDFMWETTGAPGSEVEVGYVYLYFNSDSFVDRAGRIPTHVAIEYNWYLEYSDDKTKGLPRVRFDWQEWVESYAAAQAKKILGQIRNKFKGIPGPDGQVLSLDGADLLAQADDEIRELTKDLEGRARQLPMMID